MYGFTPFQGAEGVVRSRRGVLGPLVFGCGEKLEKECGDCYIERGTTLGIIFIYPFVCGNRRRRGLIRFVAVVIYTKITDWL